MIRRLLAYCLVLFSFFFIFSCGKEESKEQNQYRDIEKFVKNYNRFTSTEDDVLKADSVGQIILTLQNTQQTRDLLRRYILLTAAKRSYIDYLFKQSRKKDDLENEAHAYFLLGQNFGKRFQTDSTFYNLTKAEFLFKSINDSINLQDVYAAKAVLLINHNIFAEGKAQIVAAMNINKDNKSAKVHYSECMIMANALTGLERYDEALKESERALKLLENPDLRNVFNDDAIRLNKVTINANISEVYIKQGEYEKAKLLIRKTVKEYIINESIYDSLMLAHLLYNLADAEIRSKSYNHVEQNLKQALALQKKYNNLQDFNSYKTLLGEFYYITGKDSEAREILNEVMSYAIENSNLILEKNVLTVQLKYKKEDYNEYFTRYETINKYILDENNMVKNTFARLSFEADNLQRINEKLERQKEMITKVGGVLLFLATVGFFILIFRQKNKEVSLIKLFQRDTEKYYDSIMNVQNELTEARNLERKEIAKELHDGVLNRLFVTRFLLMQVSKDSVDEHRDSLIHEVKEVEQYIRGVSHALANEEDFKINEFSQLLEDLVSIQNRSESTKFSLFLEEGISFNHLGSKYKVHIYRIVQECLQNVHKHAKAGECDVSFVRYGDTGFKVSIIDNGIGFNTNIVRRGIGFTNIKGRIEFMKSKLIINSTAGQGCSISFIIETKKGL